MLMNDPDVEIVEQSETVMESIYTTRDGETMPLRSEYDLTVRVTRKRAKSRSSTCRRKSSL
jgi:hypothetical protein